MPSKNNVTPSILTIFTFVVITAIAALIPAVSAEVVAIANLNDSYMYQEVTVAGSIVSVRSWQGTVYIMTVDDGSGTVSIKYESRLLENPQGGQRVRVTGVYEGKGTIYAKNFGMAATSGYTDTTVAELKKYPAYYYGDAVRVRGDVSKIILTHEQTELVVEDGTGEIKVVFAVAGEEELEKMEDLNLDDKVAVEGRCYQDTISAFAIIVEKARPPSANQSSTPSPVTQPTPTPENNPVGSPESTSTPAFQILPALGALLAVAYLLRRGK
jgi:cytochrome c-type biogenesis protein CcmE